MPAGGPSPAAADGRGCSPGRQRPARTGGNPRRCARAKLQWCATGRRAAGGVVPQLAAGQRPSGGPCTLVPSGSRNCWQVALPDACVPRKQGAAHSLWVLRQPSSLPTKVRASGSGMPAPNDSAAELPYMARKGCGQDNGGAAGSRPLACQRAARWKHTVGGGDLASRAWQRHDSTHLHEGHSHHCHQHEQRGEVVCLQEWQGAETASWLMLHACQPGTLGTLHLRGCPPSDGAKPGSRAAHGPPPGLSTRRNVVGRTPTAKLLLRQLRAEAQREAAHLQHAGFLGRRCSQGFAAGQLAALGRGRAAAAKARRRRQRRGPRLLYIFNVAAWAGSAPGATAGALAPLVRSSRRRYWHWQRCGGPRPAIVVAPPAAAAAVAALSLHPLIDVLPRLAAARAGGASVDGAASEVDKGQRVGSRVCQGRWQAFRQKLEQRQASAGRGRSAG